MADYRQAHSEFYKKARKWTPIEREIFKFLCEHGAPKVCGLHTLDVEVMEFFLGYSEEEIFAALDSLAKVRRQIVYESNQIFIHDYAEHQGQSEQTYFPSHVHQTFKRDYREGNKASEAFKDKYADLLAAPLPKRTRKKTNADSDSETPVNDRPSIGPGEALDRPLPGGNSSNNNSNDIGSSDKGGVGEIPIRPEVKPDIPANVATVEMHFMQMKCANPKQLAQAFMDHFNANGWTQPGGQTIRHWPSEANKWARGQPDRERRLKANQIQTPKASMPPVVNPIRT